VRAGGTGPGGTGRRARDHHVSVFFFFGESRDRSVGRGACVWAFRSIFFGLFSLFVVSTST
jgi:hypothetical protein